MRRRVLSFLLAASAAFCFICSSAPEAHAIVPIGLVQSALASYVTSAGYKMWSENGGPELMVEALSTLYQSWLDSTDPVGALTLGQMSENDYVYLDNSGQIVIRKAAADMFQQFSDWIQTEYSVPVGSETPTTVIEASPGSYTDNAGINCKYFSFDTATSDTSGHSILLSTAPLGGSSNPPQYRSYVLGVRSPSSVSGCYATRTNDQTIYILATGASGAIYNYSEYYIKNANQEYVFSGYSQAGSASAKTNSWVLLSNAFPVGTLSNIPLSEKRPTNETVFEPVPGVAGLGVTIAQAVADVVGQAKEDDAVVIGVGASAGATAQDIADIVAQGIKAQTLNPSVSITAEAVIDTPVQPYPDIEGLGLPSLGAALVERFPFCIPWDFVDTVKLLSADPQPINIKVDLIPQRIKTSVGISSDTSFDIDLSGERYAKIGVFCRWGSLITFCFGLFLLTKRLIWTA